MGVFHFKLQFYGRCYISFYSISLFYITFEPYHIFVRVANCIDMKRIMFDVLFKKNISFFDYKSLRAKVPGEPANRTDYIILTVRPAIGLYTMPIIIPGMRCDVTY